MASIIVKRLMRVPPFHSLGDDNGHFYALAFVPGFYVPPSGKSKDEAFFVLNFSSSEGFTQFSLSTVSATGKLFHYTRGTDEVDSAEYAMLRAWREERVPFEAWRFYPSDAVEASAFVNDETRTKFEAARLRVAYIIFEVRNHVWVERKYPRKLLFHFGEADIPEPMVSTPEYEDITKCITGNAD